MPHQQAKPAVDTVKGCVTCEKDVSLYVAHCPKNQQIVRISDRMCHVMWQH